MKSITLNPISIVMLLLASGAVGSTISGLVCYKHGQEDGLLKGRLTSQHETASTLSAAMTQGVILRTATGAEVRYVLRPIAMSQ